MAKHGVFCAPEVIEEHCTERTTSKGTAMVHIRLRVKHTFYAPDGSSVVATTVGEAMDSGDKSCNKAMSAAMKYAYIELFCIPTVDDKDTENESPEVAPIKMPQRKPTPQTRTPAPVPETPKTVEAHTSASEELGLSEEEIPDSEIPMDHDEIRVGISSIKMVKGTNKKTGKPWTMYVIQTDQGEFSSFDKAFADVAKTLEGKYAIIKWKPGYKEGSKDIVEIREAK
jgi:hypothetical protein